MIAFTASGQQLWSQPNYTPQIATVGGGVIGTNASTGQTVTFDKNGSQTGQTVTLAPNPTQYSGGQWPGWLGNAFGSSYSIASGEATLVSSALIPYEPSYAALLGGNNSVQGTAIQQVQTKAQGPAKQLPDLNTPTFCPPYLAAGGTLLIAPTCGNLNAIELLTDKSPDYIFEKYIQTYLPVSKTGAINNNSVMIIDTPEGGRPVVSGVGQTLRISLVSKLSSWLQEPFYIMTERFDPASHTISVVTLEGHPLAGWRYWRVYSIGTNDVVIETGAYDQPGYKPLQYAGYYVAEGTIHKGWQEYMQFIQNDLRAAQGSHLGNALGGISLRKYPWESQTQTLLGGYMDYLGDFTNYILNNVCQASSCN
jgi:hypothetical protein